MTTALVWANILLLLACVLPLWRNEHWLIRSLDFPRLQFSVALLIMLAAAARYARNRISLQYQVPAG